MNEWIPYKEGGGFGFEPDKPGAYLCCSSNKRMAVGYWSEYGWGFGHYFEDVRWWMPLPIPPEMEK